MFTCPECNASFEEFKTPGQCPECGESVAINSPEAAAKLKEVGAASQASASETVEEKVIGIVSEQLSVSEEETTWNWY